MNPNELVSTEIHGRVLLLTLQRHAKRNAIDRATADALDAALNELDDNADIWAGVLAGGPYFCAGSDLASRGDYVTQRGGEYGIIRRHRRKPLVAAIEGGALGGGLEIALACDLVVAASDAKLGLPEVARGLIPTCGALFRALQRLPRNVAHELVLTGQPMTAERAHGLGFVNVLTAPGEATARALEIAQSITANAPIAVQACLAAMRSLQASDDAQGWEATETALAAIRGSEDAREGVLAFFERRAPVWRGR
jgi:enoyl-CoA hydratase/carnithine racemase